MTLPRAHRSVLGPADRRRTARVATWSAAGILLALYVSDAATGWTGQAIHGFLRDWFVLAVYAVAAASCLRRGIRVGADRLAWMLLAAGIGSYAAGTLVFVLDHPGDSMLNAPVASEVLWLAFYPAAIAALMLLVAVRAPTFPLGTWLDAATAALSLGAVLTAVALPDVTHPVLGTRTIAAGITFPGLDIVLVTLSLWVLSLTRWRPHPSWVLMTGAFTLLAIGDTALAIRGARGVFVRGELTSACFPLAMAILALAAREPPAPDLSEPMVSLRVLVLPGAAALAAAGVLGAYVAHPFSRVSAWLAVAAVCVGFVRALSTAAEVRGLYESRRFARGFHDSALGLALVTWDLRWMRVNPALCRMLRYRTEDLIGHSVLEVTFEDDLLPVEEERLRGLVDLERSTFEKRYVRSDGAVLDVQITTSLIEDEDDGTYFYTQVQDITERRRAERRQALIAELGHRALDASDVTRYLQHAVDAVAEALHVPFCCLVTPTDGDQLEFVVETGGRLEPYPSDSMAGWALSQQRAIISNDLLAEDRFPVHPGVAGRVERGIAVPVRAQRPHTLLVSARADRDPFESEDAHFLESVANILTSVLDRAATDQELRRLALVDSLTGLANRATLEHHLASTLAAGRRLDHSVAVLLLDVDNFKLVNDTLGHPAGDQLLREIADRLHQAVREEDLLARLGGDEFVVVCTAPGGDPQVPGLADRLLNALSEPFPLAGQNLHISASVGVAVSGPASDGPELLRDADIAMYRAKGRPGSGYEVFDADLRRRILERVELERGLREALSRDDELVLYYQPIVDLWTGTVRGFESLVRWQHPRDGLLSPGVFLPVAEESGLIVPLGEHLLAEACAQAARWRSLGDHRPYVSFNLSARQLTPDIPEMIALCLRDHAADPRQLRVEVTEHVLLSPEVAVPVLRELREMGIAVVLDDFGTGYSSLSYLETYPLDAIKLDRGFVARANNQRSAAIIRAAVSMGAALGLEVVAEGIELEEQKELLRSLGCVIGQGYLFGRPMPARDADAIVAGERS